MGLYPVGNTLMTPSLPCQWYAHPGSEIGVAPKPGMSCVMNPAGRNVATMAGLGQVGDTVVAGMVAATVDVGVVLVEVDGELVVLSLPPSAIQAAAPTASAKTMATPTHVDGAICGRGGRGLGYMGGRPMSAAVVRAGSSPGAPRRGCNCT